MRVYDDKITILSDNHTPMDYYVQVTVTSDNRGSALFDVLNEFYEDVAGASIVVQNDRIYELTYTLSTAADGTVMLADVPEGYYRYNISAPGHTPWSGMFRVEPGLTTTVPIALQVNLVSVEWSVTPVLLEDRYEITVSQTFETKVPAPVIVIDPMLDEVPYLAVGETYYGEFTITNHGLIEAYDFQVEVPTDMQGYEIVVFSESIPDKLGAQQSVTVPYRITRLPEIDSVTASGGNYVDGYGGAVPQSWCSKVFYFKITCKCTICGKTAYAREVTMTKLRTVKIIYECINEGALEEALQNQVDIFKDQFGSDAIVEYFAVKPTFERETYKLIIPLCHTCEWLEEEFEDPPTPDSQVASPADLGMNVRAGYYCLLTQIDSYNASRPKGADEIGYELKSAYRTDPYNEHLWDTYWFPYALKDLATQFKIDIEELKARCPDFWDMVEAENDWHKLGKVNKASRHADIPSKAFDIKIHGTFANTSLDSMASNCDLYRPYPDEGWHYESIWDR